jgi:hypothetical protein
MEDCRRRSLTAIYSALRRPSLSCLGQRLATPLEQFRIRHITPGTGCSSCRPPPTGRRVACQAAPDTALERPQGTLHGHRGRPRPCPGIGPADPMCSRSAACSRSTTRRPPPIACSPPCVACRGVLAGPADDHRGVPDGDQHSSRWMNQRPTIEPRFRPPGHLTSPSWPLRISVANEVAAACSALVYFVGLMCLT